MVFLCSVTVLFFCFVIAKLCKEKKGFFKLIVQGACFITKCEKVHHQRKEMLFFSDFPNVSFYQGQAFY